MEFHDTETEEISDYSGSREKWPRVRRWGPQIVLFSIVAIGLVMIVWGKTQTQPDLVSAAQYLFLVAGTLQILAAVFLPKVSAQFLRDFIEQERVRPTKYVREVDLTRSLLRLLNKLQERDADNTASTTISLKSIADAIDHFEHLEVAQRSAQDKYKVLTQADVAKALVTASANTACGTLLILAATLMQVFKV